VTIGTIVCVDDQAEVRRLLGDVFRTRGREVMSFDDGEDAVLLVHAQPGSASVWSRVGPQLAERGLDVLCVNRAGYRRWQDCLRC
jgi:CheY-like chemotaxis protein